MMALTGALKGNRHTEMFRDSVPFPGSLSLQWKNIPIWPIVRTGSLIPPAILIRTGFLVHTAELVKIKLCLFPLSSAHMQAVPLSADKGYL